MRAQTTTQTTTAAPTTTVDTAPALEVRTVVHVAPETLLLSRSIREANPDADLIAS